MFAATFPVPVQAATPNYAASPERGRHPLPHLGQYTATTAGVVKFNLPFKAQADRRRRLARASGGTSPTLTVDVKAGGTTSSPRRSRRHGRRRTPRERSPPPQIADEARDRRPHHRRHVAHVERHHGAAHLRSNLTEFSSESG
jgi:hypothetical protein